MVGWLARVEQGLWTKRMARGDDRRLDMRLRPSGADDNQVAESFRFRQPGLVGLLDLKLGLMFEVD